MRACLVVLTIFLVLSAEAQVPVMGGKLHTPLTQLLNPDGTIKSGTSVRGAIDPAGYRLATGANGEPRFIPMATASLPADTLWDGSFSLPDIGGFHVNAIALRGDTMYVGGQIVSAGDVNTGPVAMWDGTTWSGLDGASFGEFDQVTALDVIGSDLYAAGLFSEGPYGLNRVRKWDGTSWTDVASSMNSACTGMAHLGTDLYIAGEFSVVAGIGCTGIAKWNGSSWSDVGGGSVSGGMATSIVSLGGSVYLAGGFTSVAGVPASNIARWNGISWSALGSGTDGLIRCITTDGTNIYIGGDFLHAGGLPASNVAKWDGSTWSGFGNGFFGTISCLGWDGSTLYVGGNFTAIDSIPVMGVARWNGSSWEATGGGLGGNGWALTMARRNNTLVVGGGFTSAGGIAANNIAQWNGSVWSSFKSTGVHNGVTGAIAALASSNDFVYAGGGFSVIGNVSARNVARYDGVGWSPLGSGTDGVVRAIAVRDSNIYVGGDFTTAGGVTAPGIAKWDGTSWSGLGTGIGGKVCAIATGPGGVVYVGGIFSSAGGTPAANIAKWDGSAWSALAGGITGSVFSLAVNGSLLYAGGIFDVAGGVSATNVAQWDGTSWSAMGAGLYALSSYQGVLALAMKGSTLYAGGDFTSPAQKLASWDGSSWSPVTLSGASFFLASYEVVRALAVKGADLYIGGQFVGLAYLGAGTDSRNLLKWNGTTTSTFGSPPDYFGVLALTVKFRDLYVGGVFYHAGAKPAGNLSRWFGGVDLTSFSPATGIYGTPVTLQGGEFDTIPSNNTVKFGSFPATVLAATRTSLTVAVPNGAVTSTISVTLHGQTTVTASAFTVLNPRFHASAGSVDFGKVAVGFPRTDTIHVTNPGTNALFISTVHSDSTAFTVSPSGPINLAPAGSANIYITFNPSSGETKSGNVIVASNAPTSPDSIHLAGVGGYAGFALSRHVVAFGSVPDGIWDSVTVRNPGDMPVTISSSASSGSDFLFLTTGTAVVTPGDSLRILIGTRSTTGGPKSVALRFVYNGAGSPDTLVVTSTALTSTGSVPRPEKWVLVSNPYALPKDSLTAVFPAAQPPAYRFAPDTGYVQSRRLFNGTGYWALVPTGGTMVLTGVLRESVSVNVKQGWNLVGSTGVSFSVLDLGVSPGGITASQFFGYDGNYVPSDTIRPGNAYWVKMSAAGRLLFDLTGHLTARQRLSIVPTEDIPPAPPVGGEADAPEALPARFELSQNYPNPFNPTTVVRYELPVAATVRLSIFNVLGEEVARLVDDVVQEAGDRSVTWDAGMVPSGVYFCRLRAGSFVSTEKMLLIR